LKKTIIFDLDETLVHCVEDMRVEAEVVVYPEFSPGDCVPISFNIRPFAREVLAEANKYFEVIVFTAAQKPYADSILDYLDPSRTLIHHRLYRDNCLMMGGYYMKDLRIFNNRRIQDLVIVDNSAYSFGYHLDNGIPIISWHDDPCDRELFNLIHYLKILARCDDVRVLNRQYFKLKTFYEDYIQVYRKRTGSPARSPERAQ
jgi:CTD small phosphatase-like protein 2